MATLLSEDPMTSFGWKSKRKIVDQGTNKPTVFNDDEQIEPGEVGDEVDWLNHVPIKKQKLPLEDSVAKANRLKEEGVTLAGVERYGEAIFKWDEALLLIGDDEKILDMKAQALTELHELYPAVSTALKAVNTKPTWWESRQTLGRAQLNLGEIKAAIRSFQKAIHIRPDILELWEEDLNWSFDLWKKLTVGKNVTDDELSFHVRECVRIGIRS